VFAEVRLRSRSDFGGAADKFLIFGEVNAGSKAFEFMKSFSGCAQHSPHAGGLIEEFAGFEA